ncbi:glycyl radical enzyme [Spirochaetia bacterium]|nr:glycyl radical enzyme [Spirochaetia bacterium]
MQTVTETIRGTNVSSILYTRLWSEMNAYYRTMREPLDSDGVNPEFLAVREKIYNEMDSFYHAAPDTPAVLLKSTLHEVIARHFEPVIFAETPFFFEMGLRNAGNWGLPDAGMPARWVCDKRSDILDMDLLRNLRGDDLTGPIGLTTSGENCFDVDHHCLGYTRLFKTGIRGILSRIRAEKDTSAQKEKNEFFAAAEQSCNALLKIAGKFADRAEAMLSGEPDPLRRRNLSMIAVCARRIPAEAPQSFYEGLAMLWFTREVVASIEGIGISVIGHVDRLLGPLYEADIERGVLDEETARDLLLCWLLPTDVKFAVREGSGAAIETSTCMELGGCDETGAPVWNDVTRLILEVHEEHKLLNPKLNCRFSSASPGEYIETAAAGMLRGHNNYVMLNDDILIPSQVKNGKTLEEARLYVNGGCQEIMVEGVEHTAGAYYYLSMPRVLDLCIRPFSGEVPDAGPDTLSALPETIEQAVTFADFYRSFMDRLKTLITVHIGWRRELGRHWQDIHPCPLFSATLEGCIENGRDYTAGGAKYNEGTICACGLGTIIDSLIAIKKAVYDEKQLTLEELRSLLASNWVNAEPLRRRFIAYPKYGHGEDEPDALAAEFVKELSAFVGTLESERGGHFQLSMFVYFAYSYFAKCVRATPDGRKNGDLLSQGVAPGRLRGTASVTDSIRSLNRIDFLSVAGNSVLDVQMPVGKMESAQLAALIRSFGTLGGPTIQPNFVSVESLLDAQHHPENHTDLMVRICGLSAYFVRLDREAQDEIIQRNLYAS